LRARLVATVDATAVLSGKCTTPASDAASTARCIREPWAYQEPRSTANAVNTTSGTINSAVMAIT